MTETTPGALYRLRRQYCDDHERRVGELVQELRNAEAAVHAAHHAAGAATAALHAAQKKAASSRNALWAQSQDFERCMRRTADPRLSDLATEAVRAQNELLSRANEVDATSAQNFLPAIDATRAVRQRAEGLQLEAVAPAALEAEIETLAARLRAARALRIQDAA